MNIKVLLHRCEIIFWMFIVSLMKNSRALRWTFVVGGFIFLATLLSLGAIIVKAGFDSGSDNSKNHISPIRTNPASQIGIVQPSAQVQNNLLVILVDSLESSKPELMGVWLIGQAEAVPQLVFLPLFPTYRKPESDLFLNKFKLDAGGQPAGYFLELLRSKNIWWNHYLIVDRTSLAELVELSGYSFQGSWS